MRIIILGTAHPYRGGLAAYNMRLARQFITEGNEAEIVTFTLQYPEFLFPGKTQYTKEPAPEDISIIRRLNSINPFNWIKTGLKIKRLRPDILLIKYWHPFMSPCFGTVARIAKRNKKYKTAVICIFDNVIPHEKSILDRILTRYFVFSIDGAIIMSRSVGDDLNRFRQNLPTVYTPHPLYDNYGSLIDRKEALGKLNLPYKFTYLLFFGFIRRYKGLDLLLEALGDRKLHGLQLKLLIAGEFYESETPYREQIRNLGLENVVQLFDRFINEDEVAIFFSAADLVVQPYRSATQSGVTQIAYHFGKPMLVTDVGGLAEIVSDGVGGYVVKPESRAITEAIFDFVQNRRSGEFAQRVIKERERFTWEKMTASIFELYRRIIR
jgi:D-inositol-3-phosphate glycosyltransferase